MNAKLRSGLLTAVLAVGTLTVALLPGHAQAWWVGYGYRPPVVYVPPPPVVYAPRPYYYAPPPVAYVGPPYYPHPHRFWVRGHYNGPYWVPGHWG